MKKKVVTTTLAIALSLGTFAGVPSLPQFNTSTASAAEVNTQNNQLAVEAKADELIQLGKSLIGKATYSNTEYKPTAPYKFSCATFLMYIFEKSGVDLATYNENYMMEQGTYVAKNELQKGDLVFFDAKKGDNEPSDHVAMYIGDNKVMHMADPKQNIVITDMDSKPYYTDNYVTSRRVLPSLLPSNPATKGDSIVKTSYDLMNKVTMGTINDEKAMKFTATGFVNHIYKTNGVDLATTNIKEQMKLGTTVSRGNLKKGDLIFFSSAIGSSTPGMVGIYAGDHRIIVPNSSGVLTRVLFVDYYEQRYLTAKRVFTESATPVPVAPPVESTSPADKIINFASSLTGKASFGYGYDEKTMEFTGAGFMYYVYKNQGIDLTYKLASRQAQEGQAVQKANLQKGDLVYFSNNSGSQITQTGIYVGANQFIHLTAANGVVKQSLDSTWAKSNYAGARRVL